MYNKQETFEFDLDLDLPDEIIEDMEYQILTQVRQKFGDDYSGDNIADYGYILKAHVTVNKRS